METRIFTAVILLHALSNVRTLMRLCRNAIRRKITKIFRCTSKASRHYNFQLCDC